MTTVPPETPGRSDDELTKSVRDGSTDAYGELYERHVDAAYTMAAQLTGSRPEADDLVAESFAKVLANLRRGHGPTSAFRAYLLTTLRHQAYDRTRRDRKLRLAEDVSEAPGADTGVPFTDTAVAELERSLAARAYARMPERWQAVLWHTEIEGLSPSEVAPLLGLSPNSVSALAYRAREGLRQAYLQVHLGHLETTAGTARCRAVVERLGAWTRAGLSRRETAQVENHLDTCDRCRALAAELVDVNGGLHAVIAPLVLGTGAAGYLSTVSGGTTAVGSAGAGTATHLTVSPPRQAFTAAVSATAMVAAVAFGLAANESPRPVAVQPPVPEHPSRRPSPPEPPKQQPPIPSEPSRGQPPAPVPTSEPPEPDPAPPPPSPPPVTRTPLPPAPETPAPPPAPTPGVDVHATARDRLPWPGGEVDLTTVNTGTSTGEAEVSLTLPESVRAVGLPPACTGTGSTVRCEAELSPGDSFEGTVWVLPIRYGIPHRQAVAEQPTSNREHDVPITIIAELGPAEDRETVTLETEWPVFPPEPTTTAPSQPDESASHHEEDHTNVCSYPDCASHRPVPPSSKHERIGTLHR